MPPFISNLPTCSMLMIYIAHKKGTHQHRQASPPKTKWLWGQHLNSLSPSLPLLSLPIPLFLSLSPCLSPMWKEWAGPVSPHVTILENGSKSYMYITCSLVVTNQMKYHSPISFLRVLHQVECLGVLGTQL